MAYHRKVLEAVEVAPHWEGITDPSGNRGSNDYGGDAGSFNGPSVIRVDGLDELKRLFLDTNEALGGDIPEAYIDRQVWHESQHADAARKLGAPVVTFGLRFIRVFGQELPEDGVVCAQPFFTPQFSAPVPKLHIATVLAHPTVPSIGDIADVRALGFSGIDEVAQAAIAYNKVNELPIPVPLSYDLFRDV